MSEQSTRQRTGVSIVSSIMHIVAHTAAVGIQTALLRKIQETSSAKAVLMTSWTYARIAGVTVSPNSGNAVMESIVVRTVLPNMQDMSWLLQQHKG